jgi:hypothetical protein
VGRSRKICSISGLSSPLELILLASFFSALPLFAVFLVAELEFLFSVATELNGLFFLLILSILTRAKVGNANFMSPVLFG